MNRKIDGPFPITVRATDKGAELDISAFLIRAVLTELITDASEDPEGFGLELAGLADLMRSAVHQGRDSHARHEFDEQMQHLVDRCADGGAVPLYGAAVTQLRDALSEIAVPRPVPGQREAGAA
jgi:hypothetical protein